VKKLSVHTWRTFWAYHAWGGVAVGLALHVMFVAGTVTLFLAPLQVWEEPVQHRPAERSLGSPQALLDSGLAAIRHLPPPQRLWLGVPQGSAGVARFQYSDDETGLWKAGWIDPDTGAFVPERERAATFLYKLHYLWHAALPELEYLAGFLALGFLLIVVTGVAIHLKDLVGHFYRFRPRAGRRALWSDMHKVLGVMGLPFQVLYSYTGALMVFGPVVITALTGPVFGDDQVRASRVAWNEPAGLPEPGGPAPALPLDDVLRRARAALPGFQPISFGMQDHGREHGLVRAYGWLDGEGAFGYGNVLMDQQTGEVLHVDAPATDLPSHAAVRWLSGIHYVYYGGTAVRVLLALLALAACATILTGNWVRLARRRAGPPGARLSVLARLTAGLGAGAFVAVAALLVASRALPLDWDGRLAAEELVFFGALAGCAVWGVVARRTAAVWWRQLGLAGALLASVPVLAARLSPAGLFGGGPHLTTVVAVDAALLGCGAALLAVAWALRRADRRGDADQPGPDADPDADEDADQDADQEELP
jgi:uncharacterized iron-regulated membrane protein